MDYRACQWSLVFLTLWSLVPAKRSFTMELQNFSCAIVDPKIGKELTCIVHRKRTVPTVSVFFSLYETQNEFSIDFQMDLLKKDNTKMNLAHTRLDGCKFLSSVNSKFIYGKFFKRIQSVSNLPKKCPIRGNQLYAIRNYTVLADEFPPNLPAVTHQLRLKIIRADAVVADILVGGKIIH
ncbi:uncharacterized protein LOC135430346 isoform X1 [Drosophila montana]|uniref:uncharacterized protein LOC135430346 isoform X1 n=1 Tax=Drosophila montana TaxID=40370 RepID=UPI00313F3925